MKIRSILSAAVLCACALPALAQEATRVSVPENIKPCAVITATPADAAKQIRLMRRQGLLVTVHRPKQIPKVVSEGDFTFPMSLSRARVAASGC